MNAKPNISLTRAVGNLHTAQKQADAATRILVAVRAKHTSRKALVELSAYTAELFPNGGDSLRAAKNDSERATAIQIMCDRDECFSALQAELHAAQAEHALAQTKLDWRQNQFTVQKELVRLFTAEITADPF